MKLDKNFGKFKGRQNKEWREGRKERQKNCPFNEEEDIKIKIGGLDYKVEVVEGLADYGSTNFSTQTILLANEQTEDMLVSSLLHEIIEVINQHNDLGLAHQTIQTIEANLFQVLKDNIL